MKSIFFLVVDTDDSCRQFDHRTFEQALDFLISQFSLLRYFSFLDQKYILKTSSYLKVQYNFEKAVNTGKGKIMTRSGVGAASVLF